MTDAVGAGRYRGGAVFAPVFLIWNTNDLMALPYAGPSWFMLNQSLCGGYPSPAVTHTMAKNTNVEQLIASGKPLPHEQGDPRHPELV